MLTGLLVVVLAIYMLYDIDLLNWVFTQWQWSVVLYKIGKRQHKRRCNAQINTKSKSAQNRTQKYKTKNKYENNIQHKLSTYKITKKSKQ
jgi:hypothetical protein